MDFVVIDPERGWLGIEVKGGRISQEHDDWFSTDRFDKRHGIKNPAQQVQKAVHLVGNHINSTKWFERNCIRPSFGWAVVLPDVDVEGNPGLELPLELLIGRDQLKSLGSSIDQAFSYHNLQGPKLEQGALTALIGELCPSLRLVPAIVSRLDEEQEALVALTDEQFDVISQFEDFNRLGVNGPAGSGKTMLAMEKCRRLAGEGKRVLLLCYNRPLALELDKQAEGFKVQNFHAFCSDMAKSSGVNFKVPKDAEKARSFWEEEAVEILNKALDVYPDERFDAVIVDEGQDFRELWWLVIEKLLADPQNGTLYVFYDPNQNLFGGGPTEALELNQTKLRYNCRNTREIAKHSAAAISIDIDVRPNAPDGLPVEVVECKGDKAMVDAVKKQLHRLVAVESFAPQSIVVMSPRAGNSPVWSARKLGNITLVKQDAVPGANEARFVSLRSFKGLEADAVILCDVSDNAAWCTAKDVYVGTSRARHALVVIKDIG